jgi:hypothetical protein
LLTITRRLALHVRSVLRRIFPTRAHRPNVSIIGSAEGLRVRAAHGGVAVEYREARRKGPAETLWLPHKLLADCEGRHDDPVQLEALGPAQVVARWQDRGVPQMVQYESDSPSNPDDFPDPPESFAENPPFLLRAISDASDTTDPGSLRYALGHLLADGTRGTLTATDGRQLLVQSGFTFPWTEKLLIPATRAFTSPELSAGQPVLIGRSGDWAVVRTGNWTIWLAILKDGRYPETSHHLPNSFAATSHCRIPASDRAFLAQALPRLPGEEELNWPVTLELNGTVAVRGKAPGQSQPTELVLTNSTWDGEPVRINTNRRYLARAAQLGFQEIHLFGPKPPVCCQDDHRQYVWVVLDPESAIRPHPEAIRVESPRTKPATRPRKPLTRRKTFV